MAPRPRLPSAARSTVLDVPPSDPLDPLTHRLFRFPAKFYPPAARELVARFARGEATVYDPFCGSGTLMIEAARLGFASIGSDLDPLAVFIAQAKTMTCSTKRLAAASSAISAALDRMDRGRDTYSALQLADVTETVFERERVGLRLPAIPNLDHWFRRYVTIDLARIRGAISDLHASEPERMALLLAFASIIRNASNADPVPVSGLEVTAHMRRRDAAGRVIDPFNLYRAALTRTQIGLAKFAELGLDRRLQPVVFRADAATAQPIDPVELVVTSPPYNGAVDYYRRHQLEMYWLDLTTSHQERLALLPGYIGRPKVPMNHPPLGQHWEPTGLVLKWYHQILAEDAARARAFRAYMQSMGDALARTASCLNSDGRAVFVVGRSSWNGHEIPTDLLFAELGANHFALDEVLTYATRNRYMSYSRKNLASIDREIAIVLRRRP